MELCKSLSQPISTPPTVGFLTPIPSFPPRLRPPPLSRSTLRSLRSRFLYFNNPLLKATTSEETSSIRPTGSFGDDRDGVATFEEVSVVEKNVYNENLPPEESKSQLPLDSEDAYPIILYGSGALVALWLASAVVGAIDSIPLFPKLLEVVGLCYTVWFSSRYLLFKKDREELAAKIEELKRQVLGSDNE